MQISIIPVTPFQQNCSLIWCEVTGAAAIVDPGGDVEVILAEVAAASKAAALSEAAAPDVRVRQIMLTHGHLDHAGATAALAARLGVPIIGPHRADAFLIETLSEQGERYGLDGPNAPAAFQPDRWLEDGDVVELGELRFEVLHCPGHTPGHVVFFERGARYALVGDVLFKGSIGRSDLPRGNYEALIGSIRNKLWPLGEDVTFLPGHGDTSTFGWERMCNPFVADLAFEF